jgi:hypothetical protein
MPDDDPYGHPSDPDEDRDNGVKPEPDDPVAPAPPPRDATTGDRIRERLHAGTHRRQASPVPGRGRPTWHAWRTRPHAIHHAASR